jgi:hypothetical protein
MHPTPLCRPSSPSNSTLPHTRSNQRSTHSPPRKRNNSKVSPNKPTNNPCPSSAWVADPVDTVPAEDRSTFVAVVVGRRIVADRSLGRLGDRSCKGNVSILLLFYYVARSCNHTRHCICEELRPVFQSSSWRWNVAYLCCGYWGPPW